MSSVPFEREQAEALERLREHYALGELSLDDLTKRVGAASAARTSEQLEDALRGLEQHPELLLAEGNALGPHLIRGERLVCRPYPSSRQFSGPEAAPDL